MVCPEGHYVTVEDFNLIKDPLDVVGRRYEDGYMCFNCDRTYGIDDPKELKDQKPPLR